MRNNKFEFGITVATNGVNAVMEKDQKFADFVFKSLMRHGKGDWGDMRLEDRLMNDEAVKTGESRIFSAYNIPKEVGTDFDNDKIWIITEWDRSATTVLFPCEY